MPKACQVCTHDDREEIDRALVSVVASTGHTVQSVADRFGLSYSSVWRHSGDHLDETLVTAVRLADEDVAVRLLDDLRALIGRAEDALDRTEARAVDDASSESDAVRWFAELRQATALLAKVIGAAGADIEVNVIASPEWATVRAAVAGALAPWPEAGLAVAGALGELEEVG